MRKYLLGFMAFGVLLILSGCIPMFGGGLTGTWGVTWYLEGGTTGDLTMDLQQSGSTLTGTLHGTYDVDLNGTVDSNGNVVLNFEIEGYDYRMVGRVYSSNDYMEGDLEGGVGGSYFKIGTWEASKKGW